MGVLRVACAWISGCSRLPFRFEDHRRSLWPAALCEDQGGREEKVANGRMGIAPPFHLLKSFSSKLIHGRGLMTLGPRLQAKVQAVPSNLVGEFSFTFGKEDVDYRCGGVMSSPPRFMGTVELALARLHQWNSNSSDPFIFHAFGHFSFSTSSTEAKIFLERSPPPRSGMQWLWQVFHEPSLGRR